MAANSPLQKFYILIGSIFSVFYVFVGIMFLTGLVTFGLEYQARMLFGIGIFAYGIFRVFMFYKRYKRMREGE
ncbi:MAG TPA: hypothetical protein VK806_14185 [Bacteroidia bacterium]|nr:hypothetical protein [Bacteroidia bacterium]